jgi:hypothetical protein
MHRLAWNLILLPLAVAISGCGSSEGGISVHGKLTKGGAKYEVPADQKLHMFFYSIEPFKAAERTIPAGEAYMVEFKPEDSTFTVAGPDGQGIPPGKYHVSVTQKLTREAVDKKNAKLGPKEKLFERDTDMLDGRYSDKAKIICEVKDSAEIVIDLDKAPTG